MKSLTIFYTLLLFSIGLKAQEEASTVYYAKRYLDLNIHSLDKYGKRVERQQDRLLSKLARKEKRLGTQLRKNDSAGYAKFLKQPLSYDSIRKLLHPDSVTLASKTARKLNPAVDSLKRVQAFLQSKLSANSGNAAVQKSEGTGELNTLQSKLSYQQYINGLIDQRSFSLKNIASSSSAKIPALGAIQEQVFYAKSKMNVWKQIAEDPSLAEEKALEYLQGVQGFDKTFEKPMAGGMHSANSADELEKMGYQTKRQLNAELQQKFGGNVAAVQEQMGSQVSDWQNQTQGLGGEIKNAKQQISTAKKELQETKQSISQLKQTQKPAFKVNPMRGLPFWKRIEKQYSWQTARATSDGLRPAILEVSAMAGFKQTPKLSYGLGIAASVGLGQNWSNVHFSFEGVGLRSYAAWQLKYGIGAYAGYERLYKSVGNTQLTNENNPTSQPYNTHFTSAYQEAVLIGLTKSYKINSKWNGAMQVLFDIWWKEKGLNSPVILRFATTK